jgi:5-methylcytosine-specific restriction endonuclease McrA
MKHLSSSELLSRTKQLAADERRTTLALIEHLEEIQRRMLFAEIGYASLWEYVTKELGLSEGSAQRRIAAMRLIRKAPEAREAIKSGELSLSNASKVESFLGREKKAGRPRNASAVVQHVRSQSQKQCEATLFEISPEAEVDAKSKESDRIISKDQDRLLKLTLNPVLYEKIQRIKGLLAHSIPEASYAELLDYMTNEVLAKLEKKRGIHQASALSGKPNISASEASDFSTTGAAQTSCAAQTPKIASPTAAAAVTQSQPLPNGRRVYLPASLKKAVWAKAGGQCEIEANGKRCTSRYRLEIDHKIPLALNGGNDLKNLRLICRTHNQQQARAYGIQFKGEAH